MPTRNELFFQLSLAVLLPPLAIYFQLKSYKRREFWNCVLLTLLGYFPGLIYALYHIVVVDHSHREEEVHYRVVAPPLNDP
ncbi:hypothetical protein V2J09_023552 [Rumex salicifolius]